MKASLLTLLTVYWEAKLAVRMAVPSVSDADLDKLAEAASKIAVPEPAPKAAPTAAKITPAAKAPAPQPAKAKAPASWPVGRLKKDGTPAKKPGPKPGGDLINDLMGRPLPKTSKAASAGGMFAETIANVMGSDVMGIHEVTKALQDQKLMPQSTNPSGYVGQTLVHHDHIFEKVPERGRGFYRVKDHAQ